MQRLHRLLALLLLAVALASAVWWNASGGVKGLASQPVPAMALEMDEDASPSAVKVETPPVEVKGARTVSEEPAVETDIEAEAAPAIAGEAPTCVLLGRVVDEEGRALPDVLVRALASRTWTKGVVVPRLEGAGDLRGFEVRTDASGSFEIEAPVPTAAVVLVRVRPDPFHDSWDSRLGTKSSCDGPPLAAGTRDLGEIRLARAGAIRGRVTDESGAPLAGVEMSTGPQPGLTYQRGTFTEHDGTYLVPHAIVGNYGVSAKLAGYLREFETPVTVEAGRETIAVDFVLRPSPSIEGVVINELGRPVEGARLRGRPNSSGSGASARSRADGSFVIYLPQEQSYSFTVERDGYATWDAEGGHETTFEPGARDLEIVLRSAPRTRFLIVDARTGAPIEAFGLGVLDNNGAQAKRRSLTEKRPPRQANHPGGVVEVTARPGIDQYIVAADGYLMQYGEVEHGAGGDPSQTLRMQSSGVVRGRVMREGQSVSGAAVTLSGTTKSGRRGPDEVIQHTIRVESNQRSTTVTDAEGRFSLDAPSRGEHRLVFEPREGAPLVIDEVRVEPGEVHDLGELELLPGATVDGRVLLPPGVEPAGLVVFLGHWQGGVKTVTDAQGRFRFDELAAGEQTVMLDDRPGFLAGGAQAAFELHAGQVTEVTIDAREYGVCAVTLQLDLGGLPVTGIQVDLIRVGELRERETLGKTDEAGRVQGFVRGWGETRVTVFLPGYRTVEHLDARFELIAGAQLDQSVRFALGTLRVALPQGIALPEEGTLRLAYAPSDAAGEERNIRIPIKAGVPRDAGGLAELSAGALLLHAVPAGNWNVRVELDEDSAPLAQVPVGSSFRIERTPYYSAVSTVVLEDGETVELRLD